jgi:hypothetical protein
MNLNLAPFRPHSVELVIEKCVCGFEVWLKKKREKETSKKVKICVRVPR